MASASGYTFKIRGGAGKFIAGAAVIAFMVMMLSRPEWYLASARKGLALYATSVLPSLFPFYFCSLLLTNIGAARGISGAFGKPVKLLYGTPEVSAYILFLSMLSGYPVGASMTAELYGAGAISEKEAKAISAFASTSGPIFMLGTVGSAIFGDVRVGAVILAAHYSAALVNGFIFRIRKERNARSFPLKRSQTSKKILEDPHKNAPSNANAMPNARESGVKMLSYEEYDDLMAKTISSSTLNMLYVGGYIVLCGMLADTLPLLKIDVLLERAIGADACRPVLALIYGMFEMTRGCMASAECSYLPLAVALCAGMISLGGLSVTLQNYTFLSRCKMKFRDILLRKLCHCLIAAGLAYLFALTL